MWIRKSYILMFCENFSQSNNISKCKKSTWSVYNKCKSSKCLLFYNIFVLVLKVCTLHAWSQILYCNLHFIQIRFTHFSVLIYVILDKWQCPPSILQQTYFICDSKMQRVSNSVRAMQYKLDMTVNAKIQDDLVHLLPFKQFRT